MRTITIGPPVQKANRIEFELDTGSLWYEVSTPSFLTDKCDAALVALLMPAMRAGSPVRVTGGLSRRLFHALPRVQFILAQLVPGLMPVEVYADRLEERPSSDGVAMGFSGGVDSFSAFQDHRDEITHLLFNDLGSHGSGGRPLAQRREARIKRCAEALGRPLISVRSNLEEFYRQFTYPESHTLRNASVALLLEAGIGAWFYSSSVDYEKVRVGPTFDIAVAEAIFLPLLSTASVNLQSTGSQHTRVEKTVRLMQSAEARSHLDVCVNPEFVSEKPNCGTCWKCLRTLTSIEIADGVDSFSQVFDVDAYRAARVDYFAEVLGSTHPLVVEVREFASERGYSFPLASWMIHALRLKRPIRKMRHLRRRFFSG